LEKAEVEVGKLLGAHIIAFVEEVKIIEVQTGRILYSAVAEGISSAEKKESLQECFPSPCKKILNYGFGCFLISQKPAVEPIKVDSVIKEEYEKGEIDWTNLLIRKNPKGKPSSLRKGRRLLMRGGT